MPLLLGACIIIFFTTHIELWLVLFGVMMSHPQLNTYCALQSSSGLCFCCYVESRMFVNLTK